MMCQRLPRDLKILLTSTILANTGGCMIAPLRGRITVGSYLSHTRHIWSVLFPVSDFFCLGDPAFDAFF